MRTEAYDERFRNATIKLLNKSILCKEFAEDGTDYEFVKENYDDFAEYFERMGFRIDIHRAERTIHLIEEDHTSTKIQKESSSKAEIAVFIILREHYLQRMDNLEFLVTIRRRDILDAMPTCFHGRNFPPKRYENVLRKLRRHDLISWKPGTDLLNPDCVITIYPSILHAQNDKAVEEFFKNLKEKIQEEENIMEEMEDEE